MWPRSPLEYYKPEGEGLAAKWLKWLRVGPGNELVNFRCRATRHVVHRNGGRADKGGENEGSV